MEHPMDSFKLDLVFQSKNSFNVKCTLSEFFLNLFDWFVKKKNMNFPDVRQNQN